MAGKTDIDARYYRAIARHLQQLRTRLGLTQAQLAERLNISSRTIARYEVGIDDSNVPNISLEFMIDLARLEGIPLWKFLRTIEEGRSFDGSPLAAEAKEDSKRRSLELPLGPEDVSLSDENDFRKALEEFEPSEHVPKAVPWLMDLSRILLRLDPKLAARAEIAIIDIFLQSHAKASVHRKEQVKARVSSLVQFLYGI